ncbi:UNVERIFIED_CONTAM: hypothetical protein GTU68_047721 [Idotea baltica]|nr:hypothetical protein [Idotea baltica]
MFLSSSRKFCFRNSFSHLYSNCVYNCHGIVMTVSHKKFINSDHSQRADSQESQYDCVGPPDKESNIRPYKYYVPKNETSLQSIYRLKREETQEWNRLFWSRHNLRFAKEKKEYIEKKLLEKYGKNPVDPETKFVSAQEMSEFYNIFLDQNFHLHSEYNKEWYRKNFRNLILAFRVSLEAHRKKVFG